MALGEMPVEFPGMSNTSQVSIYFYHLHKCGYAKFHCLALKSSLCLILVSLEKGIYFRQDFLFQLQDMEQEVHSSIIFYGGFLHLSVEGMQL